MKSVDELTEIIKLGFENVKTNLSLGYILSYLAYATEFDLENLNLVQLPGKSVYSNGVWVFKADFFEMKSLIEN